MECHYCIDGRLDTLHDRFHSQLKGQRYPLQGSIEFTERCNNRCVHCYINKPVSDPISLEKELEFEEWCRVIDQIVNEGCLWLLMTGGEVFLRPDFLEIYTYAKRKGLLITVFTNGTLISPDIADHFAKWTPYEIEITLYGASEKVYEKVTGMPGSYERCINGVNLLLERKLPLSLKTVVLKSNYKELWEMKSYADELGVSFRYDMIILPDFAKTGIPERERLTAEEVVDIELSDPERNRLWRECADLHRGVKLDNRRLYQCGAGIGTFHITASGELSICMMSREPGYNLRQGTFGEGWREAIPGVITRKQSGTSECCKCSIQPICGQCPVWSQLTHTDFENKVDYLCDMAKLRAEKMNLNLRAKRRSL